MGRSLDQIDEEFVRLFQQRYRTLYRFIRQRVDDAELTEDIAAETFTRAWEKRQGGLVITTAWLVNTAKNLIGNYYQRRLTERNRMPYLIAEELAEAAEQGTGEESMEVRFAMTRLRAADALALQLTYWDGLSASEAAAVMECSTTAFWARLTRARRALKKLLADQECVPSQPAAQGKGLAHG